VRFSAIAPPSTATSPLFAFGFGHAEDADDMDRIDIERFSPRLAVNAHQSMHRGRQRLSLGVDAHSAAIRGRPLGRAPRDNGVETFTLPGRNGYRPARNNAWHNPNDCSAWLLRLSAHLV
jgi:hypothetical protein